MKTQSALTLSCLAATLLMVGNIVMSPSGGFLCLLLASIVALFPALLARGKMRILSAVLLLVSLGLSFDRYADFRQDQTRYRQHAVSHTSQK